VAKLTQEGKEVVYCVITNGEKGIQKVNKGRKAMIAMRKIEQKAAAKVVGVSKVIFLGEIDGSLENTPKLRKKIVKTIRQVMPDTVFSLDPANLSFDSFGRFHRDHRATAEAVFDAIYPATGSSAFFPELERSGVLPHQIKRVWFFGTENPNIFIDITKTINKKIEALGRHKGQIKDMKKVEKWIRSRAREMGRKKKMKFAETFRQLTF